MGHGSKYRLRPVRLGRVISASTLSALRPIPDTIWDSNSIRNRLNSVDSMEIPSWLGWIVRVNKINHFFTFKSLQRNNKQDLNLKNLWKIKDCLQKEKLFNNQDPLPVVKRKKDISLTHDWVLEVHKKRLRVSLTSERSWMWSAFSGAVVVIGVMRRFSPLTWAAIAAFGLSSL